MMVGFIQLAFGCNPFSCARQLENVVTMPHSLKHYECPLYHENHSQNPLIDKRDC